tara:strand:+ start:342 stop:527 length:186 start_codon:yes stop_codon:yes gene_type:complete
LEKFIRSVIMDWLPSLSDSDLAFIIVFYIYLLIGSTISFFGVLIYTKIETGKSFKKVLQDF